MFAKKVNNQMAQLKRAGFQRSEWLDKDSDETPFYQYKFIKYTKEIGANCEVCVYFTYNSGNGVDFAYDRTECCMLVNDEYIGLKSSIKKVSRLAGRIDECMN